MPESPLRAMLDHVLVSKAHGRTARKFHLRSEDGPLCRSNVGPKVQEKPIEAYPPEYFNPTGEEFCSQCLARLLEALEDTYEVYEPHEGEQGAPSIGEVSG